MSVYTDPFAFSVPCFIHGDDYFEMLERLKLSPASSDTSLAQNRVASLVSCEVVSFTDSPVTPSIPARPKRKASKADVGNLDWQARSFGYASEFEVNVQDIQNLEDQYPGIKFSVVQMSDFLESAQYARMLRLKHLSQGQSVKSSFVSHPSVDLKGVSEDHKV